MLWTADGPCVCCSCWRRLAAQSHSGQRTLLHSQHPTVSSFPYHSRDVLDPLTDGGCPAVQNRRQCHHKCQQCIPAPAGASQSLLRAVLLHEGPLWVKLGRPWSRRAGDPLWWGQEALSLLEGTRLGAGVEHHGNNVKQLGMWRLQLRNLQAELGGPDTLQVRTCCSRSNWLPLTLYSYIACVYVCSCPDRFPVLCAVHIFKDGYSDAGARPLTRFTMPIDHITWCTYPVGWG